MTLCHQLDEDSAELIGVLLDCVAEKEQNRAQLEEARRNLYSEEMKEEWENSGGAGDGGGTYVASARSPRIRRSKRLRDGVMKDRNEHS